MKLEIVESDDTQLLKTKVLTSIFGKLVIYELKVRKITFDFISTGEEASLSISSVGMVLNVLGKFIILYLHI